MSEGDSRGKGLLGRVLLELERAVAREAAGGALRGAAEELRDQLPDPLEAQTREIVGHALKAIGRFAEQAAAPERSFEQAVHDLSLAGTRGALDELERQWRHGGLPLHDFMERVVRVLDRAAEYTATRRNILANPTEKARSIAHSTMEGVTAQLHAYLPTIGEDLRTLAPLGGEIAQRIGRGLLDGIEEKVRDDPAVLNALVHEVGRTLVGGIATGVKTELREHAGAPERLGRAAVGLAERTAAALVRGASGALGEATKDLRRTIAQPGAIRHVMRETIEGAVQVLLPRVPVLALAGAGGLVALSALAMRRR